MTLKSNKLILGIFLWTLILICIGGNAQNPLFKVDSNYLYRHDIVYNTPAYEGFDGFPIGNGDLGGLVWNTKNGYECQINKNDLFDKANEEGRSILRNGVRLNIDLGAPGCDWIFLDKFSGRLSLKNAEASFGAETAFMDNHLTAWVSSKKNVWFIHVKSTSKEKLKSGTKLRVSLERWGSRTFPGWYGYFSKDTKSGLSDSKSFVVGNTIVLETAYNDLRFSVACRVIGEETSPRTISANKLELESKKMVTDRDITLAISFVTSNESLYPTKQALALINPIDKKI